MKNLLTLEAVMLVNGLAIQHSSEWEDYLEMNAQIHGMTKEEYAAYYLGTQWQMQCMESLKRLTEKKVTRKQLDKAINDVAKITNDLKKVVKEWAAARDAGKTEEQAKKLEELKTLNDEKTAAQKVVDSHIQQLDKNVELETSESVNEKKSEFKEGDKVKLTLKGLQRMNRGRIPGISNDYSRSLSKIRDKDITGTVERVFPSGINMNVRFDGVLYDIKDYMVVKESVNEKIYRVYLDGNYEEHYTEDPFASKAKAIKQAKDMAKNHKGLIEVTPDDDVDDVVWTNESVNKKKSTMKKLQTLENFNEAAPKMGNSAETNNLLNLRDQVANSQKGGSEGRYGKDFEKAKTKALRAIEQMITYTKIGV